MEYLQRRRLASAVDISHALHLTAADIRHHLSILVAEGVVEIVSQRPASGRGRPASLYQLSQQSCQNNLDGLSRALLEDAQENTPQMELDSFYQRLAQRLIGESYQPAHSPSQRYVNAIQLLNPMNYQARWEAHADAPMVIFSHCPYATILAENPEMCQIDETMLSRLLGTPIKQTARLQLNLQGMPQCIFIHKK
jgi:predicted ArsR family transcriptional regulator